MAGLPPSSGAQPIDRHSCAMIGACALEQSGGALSNDQLGDIIRSVAGKLQQVRAANPGGGVRGAAFDYSLIASYTRQEVAARQDGARPFNVSGLSPLHGAPAGGEQGGFGHGGQHAGWQGLQRLAAQRDREASRDGGGSLGDGRSGSSARYDGMVSDWGSPRGLALTRSYAASNDMGWAMKDPDLMRMGKPALQALKESGLKGDGFKDLRANDGMGFDNPTIVKGADYMKRNKLNYNEAAKSMAAVQRLKGQPEELLDERKDAAKGVVTSAPDNQAERHERLRRVDDKIIAHDPSARRVIEKSQRDLGVQRGREHRAEHRAQLKEHSAQAKVQVAKIRDTNVQAAKAEASKSAAEAGKNEQIADAKGASALAALTS